MSTFDHESDDQSEACNQLIRDFDLTKPECFDSAIAYAALKEQRKQFEERRKAYRGDFAKGHLQDELYKGIAGALAQFKDALATQGPPRDPYGMSPYYVVDYLEHAVRSMHAMVLQELNLYLEEHDRAIRHDIQAVREMRERKDSIGE